MNVLTAPMPKGLSDRQRKKWEAESNALRNLSKLQGNKYVQSRIEHTYQEVEHYLKSGRNVLYTRIACQIACLKQFWRPTLIPCIRLIFSSMVIQSPSCGGNTWNIRIRNCAVAKLLPMCFLEKKI